MMFSSNQILDVSGELDERYIEAALKFALEYSGEAKNIRQDEIDRGCKLLYQITEDGKYCIGWGFGEIPAGWHEYPFRFKTDIVSRIIMDHLEDSPMEYDFWEGSYRQGFIMKCFKECMDYENEGIKNSFYGIVYFMPYTCFYAK